MIYKYQKIQDEYTTHTLREPDYELEPQDRIVELCTLDGWTYVSVPGTLPEQSEIIAETLAVVEVTPELRAAIVAASPICWVIKGNVVEKIRAEYSMNDELKMLRLAGSPESEAYNDYVESCRQWGRDRLEELGLQETVAAAKAVDTERQIRAKVREMALRELEAERELESRK